MTMLKNLNIPVADVGRLAATLYEPGQPDGRSPWPLAILFAGFTSKRQNPTNVALSERLGSNGVASLMVDLAGHGDSDGDIADQTIVRSAVQMAEVLRFVRSQSWCDSDRIGLAGSSFSGAAAVLVAAADNSLACLALKSPVTDYVDMRRRLLGEGAMAEWASRGEITLPDGVRSRYSFIEDARGVNEYSELQRIVAPILVVQGGQDEEIPSEHVTRLKACLNPAKDRLVILPEADHGYTSSESFLRMLELLGEFLSANLSGKVRD